MGTLRLGVSGVRVKALQKILRADIRELAVDGKFGPETDTAVEEFQQAHSLLADGIAGPRTWDCLWEVAERLGVATSAFNRVGIERLKLDSASAKLTNRHTSLPTLRLSSPAAQGFAAIEAELVSLGGRMSTAGGLRGLGARVSANRSSFSRHYLGEAFDLGLPTGAVDPMVDPFVITRDESRGRYWRAYARVTDQSATKLRLAAQTARSGVVKVDGLFVEFTSLAAKHGFYPIPCRRSTWRSVIAGDAKLANPMGMEWWHFQRTAEAAGLEQGQSTWGDALLRVWTLGQLKKSPPWKYRHAVLGKDW